MHVKTLFHLTWFIVELGWSLVKDHYLDSAGKYRKKTGRHPCLAHHTVTIGISRKSYLSKIPRIILLIFKFNSFISVGKKALKSQ